MTVIHTVIPRVYSINRKLRIGSSLACVYRVMNARGKFGEHERSVRVARGDSDFVHDGSTGIR